MLHELLFSLLGFTGDIIVDDGVTFRVKDGFDLLRESERDLVNRIAPLGWYYVKFGGIIERNDIGWGQQALPRVYMMSVAQGLSDLMTEYVADVSFLEQLVLSDGPMPLNQVLQHLHKYLLVFPELYAVMVEAESSQQGCRMLDYFHTYNTGVPVLKEVLDRIVLRLRTVFLKQCFAWMIHGELEDPGREFFVQAKQRAQSELDADGPSAGLQNKVLDTLLRAKMATQGESGGGGYSTHAVEAQGAGGFDWTTSYALSLEQIPSSHVSPRMASKIVFAGKAVKLLQSSGTISSQLRRDGSARAGAEGGALTSFRHSEAYKYLSSGASLDARAAAGDEDSDEGASEEEEGSKADKHRGVHVASESVDADAQVRQAFAQYVESGGYTLEDTQRFTEQFAAALRDPHRAVELLEAAVDAVNECISNRLWFLLRDSYGFTSFLQVIRSTYLLGRGELFQGLLDGILQLTYARPPDALEIDNLLNWKVLRTSAKLVGLESDDSLNDLITLRVRSSDLHIRNFALHAQDVQLVGAAREVTHSADANFDGAVRVGQKTMVELCCPREASNEQLFRQVWSKFICKRVAGKNTQGLYPASGEGIESPELGRDADSEDSLDGAPKQEPRSTDVPRSLKYTTGAIWNSDQKAVSKGFDWSATFLCTWNDIRAELTAQHPYFVHSARAAGGNAQNEAGSHSFLPVSAKARILPLGSVSCHLRGDRKSTSSTVLSHEVFPAGSSGSLVVGVIFYAATLRNVSGVRFFARTFLRTGTGGAGSGSSQAAGDMHRHTRVSVSLAGFSTGAYSGGAMDYIDNDLVFGDGIIDLDGNLAETELAGMIHRSVSSSGALRLEVQYARALQRDGGDLASVTTTRSAGISAAPSVVYSLRARLVDSTAPPAHEVEQRSRSKFVRAPQQQHGTSDWWDMDVPVNLANHVKCQGGQAFSGLEAVGLLLPERGSDQALDYASPESDSRSSFAVRVTQLSFAGKGTLSTYPVTSAPTAARHPETAARVQDEVDRVRAWMNLKLQLAFPPMFRVIFDAEAVACYDRIFALIMKVRVVAHALERLWIARSRLAADRAFCQSRHSMHFFVSNLLYYLQVDVVDSEYGALQRDIAEATDFQSVLRAHKNFTSNMLRLSLIDNLSVQDGIDRILHICLRFIAICRIMHRSEFLDVDADDGTNSAANSPGKASGLLSDADRINILQAPIYVPPEELEHIRRDFFAQVALLFQLMRKVESRGFIFRLDFNNYLSGAAQEQGSM